MAKLNAAIGMTVIEAVVKELVAKKNSKGNPYHTTGNLIVRLATDELPEAVKALGIGSANVTICVNAWPTRVAKVADPMDAIRQRTLKNFDVQEAKLKAEGKLTPEIANQFATLRASITGEVDNAPDANVAEE